MASIKSTEKALEILRKYNGDNPYILMLKRDMFVYEDPDAIGDFQIDYILKNFDYKRKEVNRITEIPEWYGEDRKEKWGITDFTPEKLFVTTIFGETDTCYSCYVQYRRSVQPVMCFLPKKAIINNLFATDYTKVEVDFDRYDNLSTEKDERRRLKDHQKEAVKFLLARKKCILADDMGLGKMEPNSSLIPTINGFKRMGDIVPGDVLFSSNGKTCNVLKTFPHKNKEIYRVTFTDNTYVDCGLDHLWLVRDNNMITRNKGWKTMSLKDMINSGLKYNNNKVCKYQIPTANPIEYTEKNYFIHPYILGMCIGDGNMCNRGINISIPNFENESVDRINSLLNNDYFLKLEKGPSCPRYRILKKIRGQKNEYYQEIKRLGLNIKGNYKFIPDEYKIGSHKQRLELLRGLMDSDGSITETKNKISFSTKSERLANDVVELVFSLGGIARLHSYNHKNKGIEFNVSIQIKENPFNLKRKKDKYNPTFKKYCTKRIASAEYVRNEDATCLMVDSEDHTYLTSKNYVVTHNTTSLSVAAIEGNFDSILIICPVGLKTNWKRELMWYVDEKYISIVDGFNNKTKPELEEFLGYAKGKSKMKRDELLAEAKEFGKWKSNKFVIINYDILDEFYTISRVRKDSAIKQLVEDNPLLKFIYNRKSCVIIDEAQNLSNSTSTQYKLISDLIKRGNPESIYLATGTPVTNNPLNLYNLLRLIENEITADYEYYIKTYCEARTFPAKGQKEFWTNKYLAKKGKSSWFDLTSEEKDDLKVYIQENAKMITTATGADNLDELKRKISHIYLRRTKEDIGFDVKKYVHEIFYDLTFDQKLQYDTLWDEYVAAQKEKDEDKELNKELLEGGIYRRYLSNLMVNNTIALCDKILETEDKVIIACCYDEELYSIYEHYKDCCVFYNGKIDPKRKDKVIDEFTNNDNIKVFVGNIVASGVGINLTRCKSMIYNNIDWLAANNKQMEDRIYRIGQTRDVDVYYQFFRKTQYEDMWNIVLRKQMISDALIKTEKEK